MASFHLCSCKTTIQAQKNLAPSTPFINNQADLYTHLTIPNNPKSNNFNHLRLRTLPHKMTQIFNHMDKSIFNPSSTTIHEDPLKIGIIGFGNFGQFIAKALKRQGHNVLATSRSDYSDYCKENGMEFFR